MGFFFNLFGPKHGRSADTGPRNIPAAPVRPGVEVYLETADTLVTSAELREVLHGLLKKAFDHPESFYDDTHEFLLSERGLTYPKDTLLTPKFVLIDTLIEHGQMAEIDWKEAEDDIRLHIRHIIAAKQLELSFPAEEQYEETDTYSVLERIDHKELIPQGYSLQILDIQSDCYVFTIVPASQQVAVEQLFAMLK